MFGCGGSVGLYNHGETRLACFAGVCRIIQTGSLMMVDSSPQLSSGIYCFNFLSLFVTFLFIYLGKCVFGPKSDIIYMVSQNVKALHNYNNSVQNQLM